MEETQNVTTKVPVKPTYEQLEGALNEVNKRWINAEQKLAAISNTAMRLNYLFQVLSHKGSFTDKEFVDTCEREIVDILTIREEQPK